MRTGIFKAIFLLSVLSYSLSNHLPLHEYRPQYFIDLPEKFIETLSSSEGGQRNLWHPKLTLTRFDHIEPPKIVYKNPFLNQNSAFKSFLQVKQQEQAIQNLVYEPANPADTSKFKSAEVTCSCQFVKDLEDLDVLSEQIGLGDLLKDSTDTQNTDSEAANDADSHINTEVVTDVTDGEDSDSGVNAKRAKKAKSLSKSSKKHITLAALDSDEDEDLNSHKNLKNKVKAHVAKREHHHKQDLKAKLAYLLDNLEEEDNRRSRRNSLKMDDDEDDFADFMEFTQKYKKYKAVLQAQNSHKRRYSAFDSFDGSDDYEYGRGHDDRDAEDYKLLKKIKTLKNKSLRNELISMILDE